MCSLVYWLILKYTQMKHLCRTLYLYKIDFIQSTMHLPFEKEQFLQRSGAIYKWISFTLHCLIRRIVLTEHSWMILSIFLTSLQDIVFHFLEQRSPKFPCSQVQQVLLIGPFVFFSCHDLLLGYQLEQNDTGKDSFEDNRDPTEGTLLCISTSTTWKTCLFLFF